MTVRIPIKYHLSVTGDVSRQRENRREFKQNHNGLPGRAQNRTALHKALVSVSVTLTNDSSK